MLFYHRLRFQHGKDDGKIAPCLCFCLVITLLFDIVVGYVFKILFFFMCVCVSSFGIFDLDGLGF